MNAPWMPPLPAPYQREVYATSHNTASVRAGFEMGGYIKTPALFTEDQMRQAQADAARAALEQAAQVCEAEYSVEGIAQRCADAIRALAKEITP